MPITVHTFKVAATLVGALLSLMLLPASVSADLSDDIEKATEVSGAAGASQSPIDVATADISQITNQLQALNRQVNLSNSTKKRLLAERERSESDAQEVAAEIVATEARILGLEDDLSSKAISSFRRRDPASSPLVSDDDPSDAIRKRKLSDSATRSEVETAEELRQARADLAAKQATAEVLQEKLVADAKQNETNLAKFESARKSVAELALKAEERVDPILAEAEAVGQVDEQQAAKLRASVKELNEQVRLALGVTVEEAKARANADPGSVQQPSERAVQGDMRQVQGIWVHRDIADNVNALLNQARADGIILSGGGFRDPAGQLAVRRANCGSSSYAIYQMPASSCRPPTARPGTSMHEQGKAIDFTYGGRTINSRSSPAFAWMQANAGKYGLQNLPSEPWHWSVNGR